METLVMKDWGHPLDDRCFDGFVNEPDFKIDEFLNFDFLENECPSSWSHDLAQTNNNGSQYSSSSSDFPSVEDEDLMQIEDSPYESGESVFQLDCGVSGMEPVHHDSISGSSNISIESSGTHNGSTCLDGSGLMIPLSSDSAEYKGLRLVHLLNACAEAMSDGAHDLVEMILCRLKELVSPTGSTMERVAYYLAQSLNRRHYTSEDQFKRPCSSISREDFLGAFSLLNQVYPYTRIAHFTANQSILESIPARAQNVHIIDFDIMEGLQWPPLMEALKSENYKIGHLKITAVKWYDEEEEDFSPSSSCSGAHTGRRLSEYAYSLGIPFSFQEVDLVNVNSKLRCSNDEVIIVNSMWDLPHMYERGKKRLVEFLQVARCLNPSLLAVGAGPRGTDSHGNLNLVERFTQCLTNLCAVFDSSEAGLADQYALARATVERLFLGPMMCRPFNSMSFQEDSEWGRVVDIPRQCGFVEHAISPRNIMYAELMVSCGEVGRQYRVECEGKNGLLLRWNSTCLTSVTTWKASP